MTKIVFLKGTKQDYEASSFSNNRIRKVRSEWKQFRLYIESLIESKRQVFRWSRESSRSSILCTRKLLLETSISTKRYCSSNSSGIMRVRMIYIYANKVLSMTATHRLHQTDGGKLKCKLLQRRRAKGENTTSVSSTHLNGPIYFILLSTFAGLFWISRCEDIRVQIPSTARQVRSTVRSNAQELRELGTRVNEAIYPRG